MEIKELEKRLNRLTDLIKVTVEENNGLYIDRDPEDRVYFSKKTSMFIQVFVEGKRAIDADDRVLIFTIDEPYKERKWWGIDVRSAMTMWVGSNIDFYIKALQLANEFIKDKVKANER